MEIPPFVDTNILLYAGSNAVVDAPKRRIASGLLGELDFCLSSQVVQEYLSNALGKKSLGITIEQIGDLLDTLRDVRVLPVSFSLLLKAWELRRRFQISHWDATIVAAAQNLGCEILYTEDLADGQDYGGVRVVNPFN